MKWRKKKRNGERLVKLEKRKTIGERWRNHISGERFPLYKTIKLTGIVVKDRKFLSDFVETVGELLIVTISENVVNPSVFVKILLNA